ncbi:thioredoxin, putative, partial [Ichthyophthirius multifiliis]
MISKILKLTTLRQKTIQYKISNTIQLTDINQWQTEVIDSKLPIVLDCYADWCDSCKKLTPILEKQALNSKGKWKLIKINIDKFPQIAQGLQIKSIPAVFLVQDQQSIDGFVGFPDYQILQQFLKNIEIISCTNPIDDEVREKMALALTFLENDIYILISQQFIHVLFYQKMKQKTI